jgi:hypothetical protein
MRAAERLAGGARRRCTVVKKPATKPHKKQTRTAKAA